MILSTYVWEIYNQHQSLIHGLIVQYLQCLISTHIFLAYIHIFLDHHRINVTFKNNQIKYQLQNNEMLYNNTIYWLGQLKAGLKH